jgi:aminomethyltransferase
MTLALSVVTPDRPRLIVPGRPALDPGVERYVLRGGGSMVVSLEAGDVLELALAEGAQEVELVAFAPDGREDAAALGLRADAAPDGLRAILSENGEDAQRVRHGLERRGLDLGRAKAAHLFSRDAPAGEWLAFDVERPVVVALAAPAKPMLAWEQDPPSDVIVHVRRSSIATPGVFRLPEPLAEPRLDLVVDIASAISFEVFEGEFIQVIDVAGRQCSDFLAFRRSALDKGQLRGLDATTTRTMTGTAYPQPGLHSKFYDRDRMPLVEVVQDTVGRHDTFNLACTTRYYEDQGYFGHPNCSDNFNGALAPFQIENHRGWPAINFFFNTNVGANNVIWFDEPWSRTGDYVLLRALDDVVCGTSACPCDIDAANGWTLTPIHVRVYSREAMFKRAIGYRMTPDSPMQLTRETGFHARTSALTRSFAPYRGYWLPSSYPGHGPIEEYWACRERAVIMDLSPLRKLEVLGPDAEDLMQRLVPRDVRKLGVGQVAYIALCYEHGGMIDDGTLFRLGKDNFRWVGGDDAGVIWIKQQAEGLNVRTRTATEQLHNVAVQGPLSREILGKIIWTPPDRPSIEELGWFKLTVGRIGGYDGIPVMVSRTGYTGELGFEIFCHPKDAPAIWDAIMEAGAPHGIAAMGLEALDIVRIEAGLVFGGADFDSTTDPFEAGIGFVVSPKKNEDYIGKAAIERRREHPHRALVGLTIAGNEPPASGDPVFVGRAEIGRVTSATRSPHVKGPIALARLDVTHAAIGGAVEIGRLDGRQKRLQATVVRFPFYDPEKTRVRA